MNKLIQNIKGLIQVWEKSPHRVAGKEMSTLPVLENAWLFIEGSKIGGYGSMTTPPSDLPQTGLEIIDASGRYVFPTWCDSHTHIVYAGTREQEFADRIAGLSYEEIAARGGGILNSAKKLASASEPELFEQAWQRLNDIVKLGTGAVEIKSGYGLDLENELKMLHVIQKLSDKHRIKVKATFLGAHAVPEKFKNNKAGYVEYLVHEMIPEVGRQKLAEFIDVFCEKNYFSVEDTDRILEAGSKYGLVPKVHVNQFNVIGGVEVCVKHHALSVDHLELISDEDIEYLKGSRTMPVALPGCSLFINIPYTPARKIIDSGLPLALATDFNPGSSPSGNMNLVVSLACINMKIKPEEAIHAATINGAYAMGLEKEFGHISPGSVANIFITRKMNSIAELPYSFGTSLVDTVFLNGEKL